MQRRLKLCAAQGQQEYHNCEVIFLFFLVMFAGYFTELAIPKLMTERFYCSDLTRAIHFLISYLTIRGSL